MRRSSNSHKTQQALEVAKKFRKYIKGNFWQVDQNFLREKIWPIVKNDSFVHDEYLAHVFGPSHPYPYKVDPKHFIGQAYDGNDKCLKEDIYIIDYVLENKKILK